MESMLFIYHTVVQNNSDTVDKTSRIFMIYQRHPEEHQGYCEQPHKVPMLIPTDSGVFLNTGILMSIWNVKHPTFHFNSRPCTGRLFLAVPPSHGAETLKGSALILARAESEQD